MQILVALNELHCTGETGLAYRNLSLENVLLQRNGYVNLIDFAKIDLSEQEQFEEQKGTSSNEFATQDLDGDWYALGQMLYELATGESLSASTQAKPVSFPDGLDLSDEFKNFVLEVLLGIDRSKKPSKDLDGDELLSSPFFDEIDAELDNIFCQTTPAPFAPPAFTLASDMEPPRSFDDLTKPSDENIEALQEVFKP